MPLQSNTKKGTENFPLLVFLHQELFKNIILTNYECKFSFDHLKHWMKIVQEKSGKIFSRGNFLLFSALFSTKMHPLWHLPIKSSLWRSIERMITIKSVSMRIKVCHCYCGSSIDYVTQFWIVFDTLPFDFFYCHKIIDTPSPLRPWHLFMYGPFPS